MKLEASSDGRMRLTGTQNNSMRYKQKACTSYYPCIFNCDPKCSESDLSTGVDVNVNATLSVEIGGAGRDQTIRVKVLSPAGSVTGHMAGGGPSGSDDFAAQVNNAIRDQLPPQVVKQLDVPFDPVSVFALKNLLFPKNYISFEGSYVPGDLLVVGSFVAG